MGLRHGEVVCLVWGWFWVVLFVVWKGFYANLACLLVWLLALLAFVFAGSGEPSSSPSWNRSGLVWNGFEGSPYELEQTFHKKLLFL